MWWVMRKLGIGEWIVRVVQAMHKNARSRVKIYSTLSETFAVKVGVSSRVNTQPLLFIMGLEALSREFRSGYPWKLLYADDLLLSAEGMEELIEEIKNWKKGMETTGLKYEENKNNGDTGSVRSSGR